MPRASIALDMGIVLTTPKVVVLANATSDTAAVCVRIASAPMIAVGMVSALMVDASALPVTNVAHRGTVKIAASRCVPKIAGITVCVPPMAHACARKASSARLANGWLAQKTLMSLFLRRARPATSLHSAAGMVCVMATLANAGAISHGMAKHVV